MCMCVCKGRYVVFMLRVPEIKYTLVVLKLCCLIGDIVKKVSTQGKYTQNIIKLKIKMLKNNNKTAHDHDNNTVTIR